MFTHTHTLTLADGSALPAQSTPLGYYTPALGYVDARSIISVRSAS